MTTSRSEASRAAARLPLPLRALAVLALLAAAPGASAQELTLPSGHAATLFEVVLEEGAAVLAPDASLDPEAMEDGAAEEELPLDQPPPEVAEGPAAAGLARFRLVVAGLGGQGAAWEDVAGDFAWLCEAVALPSLAANGWAAGEVVVALSDRETAFGVPDPQAVQFFEGFRVQGGTCVPQAF